MAVAKLTASPGSADSTLGLVDIEGLRGQLQTALDIIKRKRGQQSDAAVITDFAAHLFNFFIGDAVALKGYFLSKAQRDQVGDWYRSKVSANPEYIEAVTGAAKAFVLIGDLNASAAGLAWQTIIPVLLEQGHDLEFNVTKEQVTAAAARWIVAVADNFAPPSLD